MSFDDVMRMAQRRGFFYKTAESYPNSPAGFWDYGPLGVMMRNKFIELWRRMLVKRDSMLEIDGAQILPKNVFVASGHIESFTDPFVKCGKCGSVYRPDKLIEEKISRQVPEKLSNEEYDRMLNEHGIRCQRCNSRLSGTSRFNMMFRVGVGALMEEAYLRPETCQTIFIDMPILFKTQRIKLPIGIAQFGKSFRNEIAPRQGLLRQREFYQAEIEVFFNPRKTDDRKFDAMELTELNIKLPDGDDRRLSVREAINKAIIPNKLIGYYLALMQEFYIKCGLSAEKLRFRQLAEEERAFYSELAYDLEVKTSIGWLELVACNYRTNYDLSRHGEISGTDFTVIDDGERIVPHVFELSMGVDRSIYAILEDSLRVDGERSVLSLKPYIAPISVCVFPLVNRDNLPDLSYRLYLSLLNRFDAFYDDSGSIGRRYARADEIGVPYCITVDYDTLNDNKVTVRYRDTKVQERVAIKELDNRLAELLRWPDIFPQ